MQINDTRRKLVTSTLISLFLPVSLAGCGGEAPVINGQTVRLASVSNFRDVVMGNQSPPYRTATGQMLRTGILYRSNALTLSKDDLATINTLGIRVIYDLRSPQEIRQTADVIPDGAAYFNIPILGETVDPTFLLSVNSPAEMVALIEELNRRFVTGADQRAKFAQLFKAIAMGEDAQLFHCASGKDRTGWAAAVLLSLVGVPKEVIMEDYLLSNMYLAASIEASYDALLATYGKTYTDNFLPALGVQSSFLEAAFDQVTASYGSIENYLTMGLGLDAITQAKLRRKLVR